MCGLLCLSPITVHGELCEFEVNSRLFLSLFHDGVPALPPIDGKVLY